MVDIVLVKLENVEDVLRLAPPYGILFLADSLERAGFSVKLIHEIGTKDNIRALVDLVLAERPLLVGFSTLTGPPLVPTIQASKEIKARSSATVVWGGIHPTVLPEQTVLNDFVDLVVVGEGEETIVELAQMLHQTGLEADELSKVKGIAFKRNGQAVITEARPFIQDLDGIYPAWQLLDFERYFLSADYFLSRRGGERAVVLFTSRGCPWRCAFCYNQRANKRAFRAQSAERVLSEVRDLRKRFDITGIVFEDDNFFTNNERAIQIVRGLDVPWNSTIRVDEIGRRGESFVKELAENHCAELRIGVESGSPRILELIHKDITLDQVRKTAEYCVKYGIVTNFMFMLGFPGETWSDIDQTLKLMDELEGLDDSVHLRGPYPYVPFPGTPLFDMAIEHGFRPPAALTQWSTYFFMGRRPSLPAYADRRIAGINHYRELATRKDLDELAFPLPARVLANLARFRYERRFFSFPVDFVLPSLAIDALNKAGLSVIAKRVRPESH